ETAHAQAAVEPPDLAGVERFAGCYRFEWSVPDSLETRLPRVVELLAKPSRSLGYHRLYYFEARQLSDPIVGRAQEPAGPIWRPLGSDSLLVELRPTSSAPFAAAVGRWDEGRLSGEFRRYEYRERRDPTGEPLPPEQRV